MPKRVAGIFAVAGLFGAAALGASPSPPPVVFSPGFGKGAKFTDNGVSIPAEAGKLKGGTLLQEFQRFNIRKNNTVVFDGPPDVQRIMAKVNGGGASLIQGTLVSKIAGAAFYLINPAGVIIRATSTIDVKGDFIATTATAVKASAGRSRGADDGQGVLSISDKASFGFGKSPGGIFLREGTKLTHNGGAVALVGGTVQLNNATITVPGGAIQIVSTAGPGAVTIDGGVRGAPSRSTVILDHSALDTSGPGGGRISISAGDLQLKTNSALRSNTTGALDGRGIALELTHALDLKMSRIESMTMGNGNAGSVSVHAPQVTMTGGMDRSDIGRAYVTGINTSSGTAIYAGDPNFVGRLTPADRRHHGAAGDTSIVADNLQILAGAQVDTTTYTRGRGGNMNVQVAGTIEFDTNINVKKAPPLNGGDVDAFKELQDKKSKQKKIPQLRNSGLFARTSGDSPQAGHGGSIDVECGTLLLHHGGLISATSRGQGDAGDISVNAGFVEIANQSSGSNLDYQPFTGISVKTEYFNKNNPPPTSSGRGGNLYVSAGTISIFDGSINSRIYGPINGQALITTSSETDAAAGNLTVRARSIEIKGKNSTISSSANGTLSAGSGGDMMIHARHIEMSKRGSIAALSRGPGAGGDIRIDARDITLSGGAEITTRAGPDNSSLPQFGDAGSISIVKAVSISLDDGARIDTHAPFSDAGNISIQVEDMLKVGNGTIITEAQGKGATGGNIDINLPRLIQIGAGTIDANAKGPAGDITLRARNLIRSADAVITAKSGQSVDGTISISTPDTDIAGGLIDLQSDLQSPEARLQNCCELKLNRNLSSFVQKGLGGVPMAPDGWTPVITFEGK